MLVVGGVGVDSGDDVCDVGVGVGVGVALVLGCLRRIWLVFFFLVSFLYKNQPQPTKNYLLGGGKKWPKMPLFQPIFSWAEFCWPWVGQFVGFMYDILHVFQPQHNVGKIASTLSLGLCVGLGVGVSVVGTAGEDNAVSANVCVVWCWGRCFVLELQLLLLFITVVGVGIHGGAGQ